MKPTPSPDADNDPISTEEEARRVPSISSIFHVLWLKKWVLLYIWLALAIPVGALLSIFDIPKKYSTSSVMRFPNVVGAQTNVMRDVAITNRESIINIFRSYQVLEATVNRLRLCLRIKTPNVFVRNTFKSLTYRDDIGQGAYLIKVKDRRSVQILFRPKGGSSYLGLYDGPVAPGKPIEVSGLVVEPDPRLLASEGMEVELEMGSLDEAILNLKEDLETRSLGATNFQITLEDRDPFLVSDILNALREEFLRIYYRTTEVQEVGVMVQLEKDLELAKDRLQKSQDELQLFYSQHPELVATENPTQSDNLGYLEARASVSRLQDQIDLLQSAMSAKGSGANPEQQYFWANEVISAMSQAGEPKANILRNSLAEVNARHNQHLASLGPEHPKIKEVEAEKEGMYRQLEEAHAALLSGLQKRKQEAQARMERLAPVRSARPSVKITLELSRLTTVNTNNQQIYDRLMETYNRAKLVTGAEFFKVSVVDEARPAPYKPPSLKTRLLIACFAMLVLLAAIPAAFAFYNMLIPRIWTSDDIKRLLRIKMLGAVAYRKPPKSGKIGAPSANGTDPLLLFYGDSFQLEDVEAFRIIREETENSFRNPSNPGKYCLMMTSSLPNEGKSTCSCNLALTFARKGKRTLLVDADFRLGRVAKIFNLTVDTGLDEILGQVDIPFSKFVEIAPMAYKATVQRDLVVAPRKVSNPNAGEMVSSDRFKAFIRMAKEQFDVVIIDTPPVMITPEPLSLAELVDGVIFVCRSGITVASEAREAVEILKERRVKVVSILNCVKNTPFQHNRYKKYSYYYQVQGTPGEPQTERG